MAERSFTISENEKKKKGSLDFSRRDFLRLAGTGVMAAAAAALPGGTAMAAEAKQVTRMGGE